MKTDGELLREFVKCRDQSAFTELVNRHINVVYSAACRENQGDGSAAAHLTQSVFTELARQAAALQRHPTVVGWLYSSVRRLGPDLQRASRGQEIREQETCATGRLLASHASK